MKKKESGPSIVALATAVYDNGRRGMPRPGCDCVQCFGYCMVDWEAAQRQGFDRAPAKHSPEAGNRALNLSDTPIVGAP